MVSKSIDIRRETLLAEIFTTVIVLSIIGTFYGIVLLILKPLFQNKITSYHMYRLYKWGLIFFCVPFGSIAAVLGKWIEIPWNQNIMKYKMTEWAGSFISEGKISYGLHYQIFNIGDDRKTFLIELLPYLWMIGAASIVFGHVMKQRVYMKRMKKTSFLIEEGRCWEIYRQCGRDLGISNKTSIHLWSNDRINVPFGTGLFKYHIWMPEKSFSDKELRFILLHELTHVLRGDIFIKYIGLLINGIHWFNPFFFFYRKGMDLYCELACDEEIVKEFNREERIDYGMLLMNVPKRRNMSYISLCSDFSQMKIRLHRIANPVVNSKWSFLYMFVNGVILAGTMVSFSVLGQQVSNSWSGQFTHNGRNISKYQDYLENDYQSYEPYGLIYHKETSAFYYKGERVKIFIDERHMTEKEKEKYPWMDKSWNCFYVDSNTDSTLYLNTIRDRDNKIIHITLLDPKIAANIINKEVKVVTFHGVYAGKKGFYASDRFDKGLPKEVLYLEKNMEKQQEGGLLKYSNERETSGFIYYKKGQYPWEIEMKNGIMKVKLYTLEGSDESKPTTIQYVSEEIIKKVILYVNGKEIPLKDFT